MGWTSFSTDWCITDKRGNVDKKATMTHELERYGDMHVIKAAMGGGNYYAVVRNDHIDKTFLAVILTEVKDGEFYYKDMSDTMGPYERDCPKAILDLADELCPCTEEYDYSGYAKKWRAECRAKLAKKKLPTAFAKVKVGDWLEWHVPEDSWLNVNGESIAGRTIELTKWKGKRSWITYDFGCPMRVPTKYVNPDDCVLKA